MKIVYMGTPDFSVPTLDKLYNDKDIEISYVVTKADTKSKRGQQITYSAVKERAIKYDLKLLQPMKIKEDKDAILKIRESKPDFIIVVAYGEVLSKEILDIPRYACINGHASLLPRYRGSSPIQSAILNGDSVTGTTTMLMDIGLDTGDILEQREIAIEKKETSETLFEKLSYLTAEVIIHTIKNFNDIKPIKQDENKTCKSHLIKKEDGNVDFKNELAASVERKVRAYTPWPSVFFEKDNVQYKIWDADISDESIDIDKCIKFYDNIYISGRDMYIKCLDGYLKVNMIQKSGKSKMKTSDFINGIKL